MKSPNRFTDEERVLLAIHAVLDKTKKSHASVSLQLLDKVLEKSTSFRSTASSDILALLLDCGKIGYIEENNFTITEKGKHTVFLLLKQKE